MEPEFDSASHFHPDTELGIELVAYQRDDGTWDLLAFEPVDSIPELESQRSDSEYIFIANVPNRFAVEVAADDLNKTLGKDYKIVDLLHEIGSRTALGKVYDTLQKSGARHVYLQRGSSNDDWVLRGRRKDLEAARQAHSRLT